jgi:iron complex transport system permease protein
MMPSASAAPAGAAASPGRPWKWRQSLALVLGVLLLVLVAVALVAAAIGAAGIPIGRLLPALGLTVGDADATLLARDQLVLWSIRLPRIAMAATVGAFLAAAGAIMQGLFRNPLADPALVGVSSGGALAAAATIVAGDTMAARFDLAMPVALLPVAAFGGSLATTMLLYRIATREHRTSIAIFLLGGLALAALAGAGIGLLVFLSDDRQLRDITFWMLGSLSGATWAKVVTLAPFLAVLLAAIPLLSRGLDLMLLGEAEAFHMGIHVERLKRIAIVVLSAATGAAVSAAGVIGFVGIVVPHLLRLVLGPGHRLLLPASAAFGAILLLTADTCARVVAAPAEVPVGILTSVVGAPFFLFMLLRQRSLLSL